MDFGLDKKHEMARTLFKEFAENEAKPLAQEVDETEVFPRATVEKMAKYGFLGIPVPKEYEGQGCDPLTYVMCVEELAKVCATTSVIVSAHTSLCIDPILTYGTPEQKAKYGGEGLEQLLAEKQKAMETAAKNLDFIKAAKLRDEINALKE